MKHIDRRIQTDWLTVSTVALGLTATMPANPDLGHEPDWRKSIA